MSSWLDATPEILFALAILALPGLVVAFCLRFRVWDALGFSVPLSLGVLAIANEASIHGKVSWGLPILAGTTVGLAALCLVGMALVDRLGRTRHERPAADATDGAAWNVRQHQIAAVATLGAMIVGAIAVARGIGTPHSLNQTFDGAFHVNSINAIAKAHLASPAVLSGMTNPGMSSGFYPPTFAAVGGLVVIYTHINAINAANVVALAMAILWPITVSIAVRRIARPSAFGYSIAMAGAVTVSLFPALLLRFGTLWPNALSYLALAPALVVLLRLFGLDRTADAEDPQRRLGWWPTLVVGIVAALGLLLAHPGVLFMAFYLTMPMLIWVGWRRFVVNSSTGTAGKAIAALVTPAVVGAFFVGVVWAAYRDPTIASVRHQYWPPHQAWDQAIGQVLLLGTSLSAPNAAMAILVVIGVYAGVRHARGRYLIAGYLVVATLSVISSSIQTPTTMRWTGFWYNDPYRMFAAMAALVIPLIAIGADTLRDQLRLLLERAVAADVLRLPSRYLTASVAAGLVVCLGVLALQGGLGTRKVSNTIAMSYAHAPRPLVNPGEQAMFKRLATKVPAGQVIAGDPFTGEILAGVLSGHPVLFPTFGRPRVPDRVLVAEKFNEYQSNPAVCAAVQRLRIGVVVTGHHFFMEGGKYRVRYAGFNNLAQVRGLTEIDSGGGATAYRVGSCRG